MKLDKISVIIPCHNEEDTIEESIKSFQQQTLKPFEIIIVDDNSSDNSVEIVKKIKEIKLIKNKSNLGPAAARNRGAKIAKGNYLVFAEVDGKYSSNYLEKIIPPLKNPKIGGVLSGRRIVWTDKNSLFVKFQNLKWALVEKMMDEGKRELIGAWAFRKKLFSEMRGYNEKYWIGEDVELADRIKLKGYQLRWVPGTYFYHKDPDTLQKFIQDKKRRRNETRKPEKISRFPKKTSIKLYLLMLKKTLKKGNLKLFFYCLFLPFRVKIGC